MINRESNICNSYKICNFGGDIFVRNCCQPPCEAVSWNILHVYRKTGKIRQPPCEAESWNFYIGVAHTSGVVSLLVRLWIEIWDTEADGQPPPRSASLRGCELKYFINTHFLPDVMLASLRSYELNCICKCRIWFVGSQLPRKAASWNGDNADPEFLTILDTKNTDFNQITPVMKMSGKAKDRKEKALLRKMSEVWVKFWVKFKKFWENVSNYKIIGGTWKYYTFNGNRSMWKISSNG